MEPLQQAAEITVSYKPNNHYKLGKGFAFVGNQFWLEEFAF